MAAKVIARKEAGLAQPGLATILVGEDAASQVYVRNKHRACEKVGIQSFAYALSIDADQSKVLELIQKLNNNAAVHGILLQLPVPKQLNDAELIRAISPLKDVDGLHPENVGLLAQKGQEMRFAPATRADELCRAVAINGVLLAFAFFGVDDGQLNLVRR